MIEPINDKVFLIEQIQDEHKTKSGIFIINQEQKSSSLGKVYAIRENEWGVKEGDLVLFSRFSAEDVVMKNKDGSEIKGLKTVHIDQIHAIIYED